MPNDRNDRTRNGVIAAVFCYVLWGVLPLYWVQLNDVNTIEVICQRMIWCFVFTALVCAIMKLDFVRYLREARGRRFLIPAALLITINWSIFIYAVASGNVVEAALGYYINPLVSILLGLVCFKERLGVLQWIAVALCAIGIIYFTVNYGRFPWIALTLAVSFGIYGAVKKQGGYPAIEAIACESAIMLVPAIVVAVIVAFVTGAHGFFGDVSSMEGWKTTALLVIGGAVTAAPLILFAKAANSIPLTTVGFLQYISPTISLLTGVFILGEPFTTAHAVCFACIWTALILVAISWVQKRDSK